MSYDITALREDLAATIKALRNTENPMPVDRAKAISDVAQTIINSAKVEVDMINALGRGRITPTGFLGRGPLDTLEHQEHGTKPPPAISAPTTEPEKPYVGTPRVRSF